MIDQITNEFDLFEDQDLKYNDVFLSFCWDIVPGLPEQLCLDDDRYGTMRSIIAALVVAYELGKAVTYSRRKDAYTGKRRCSGLGYTYRKILPCIDILEQHGYIFRRDAPSCPPRTGRKGIQSTIAATPRLIERCQDLNIVPVQHKCIHLNTDSEKRVDYRDTSITAEMRKEVQSINSDMSTVDFNIAMDGVAKSDRHIIIPHVTARSQRRRDILIPYGRPHVSRIFCRESFDCGGRLYGPWQGIPKKYRASMTINGEPAVEPDFKSLHPKLAYALAGCPVRADDDLYDTDGRFERDEYKYALLITLNARHPQNAIHAIKKQLSCTLTKARDLYDEVCIRNWQIEKFIAKDKGVELQKTDSEIALAVIKACHNDGIPVLPIHDSFLVPQRYEQRTLEHMDRAWDEFINTDTF